MNASEIGEFIGALLILTGAVASMLSVFGLIRLPDVYTRSHAATKSSTLAVLLTLSGAFVFFLILRKFYQCTVASWYWLCFFDSTGGWACNYPCCLPIEC